MPKASGTLVTSSQPCVFQFFPGHMTYMCVYLNQNNLQTLELRAVHADLDFQFPLNLISARGAQKPF